MGWKMRSVSILVVDDHEIVRCGFCTLLERRPGWKTVQAADGYDAISKAVALHPDIVVMDINMPHLDGLEAARQIQQQIPTLPVVLLSGYSPHELIDKGAGSWSARLSCQD